MAAGHGQLGIAVANRFPDACVTALDWPNVLQITAETATVKGVSDRLKACPGNARLVTWGRPYDVILLADFLHHFDVPICERLTEKAHAALSQSGCAVVLEYVAGSDRTSPLEAPPSPWPC